MAAFQPLRRNSDTATDALHSVGVVLLLAVVTVCNSGCNGRTVKEDNPVFAAAPPRRSLTNTAADEEERRLAQQEIRQQETGAGPVSQAGYSTLSSGPLTGTSVVALVNGRPVFLDDVLSGIREMIEADPKYTDAIRQRILQEQLQMRLARYTDDELVLQAVEQKIPAEKRKLIRESLEPKFQEKLEEIRQNEGKATIAELDQFLMSKGTSVDQLRENFIRIQMVEGYLTSVVQVPEKIDREDLLKYYDEHVEDYTPREKVRYAKIVIRFSEHGGRGGAEQSMATVVTQLQQGEEFSSVARAMSDASNADKGGDMGWVDRDSLSPELVEILYALPIGNMSRVQTFDDRFEVYRVIDRNDPKAIPFANVQKEIEEAILQQMKMKAREEAREKIRERGHVVMIVDAKRESPL